MCVFLWNDRCTFLTEKPCSCRFMPSLFYEDILSAGPFGPPHVTPSDRQQQNPSPNLATRLWPGVATKTPTAELQEDWRTPPFNKPTKLVYPWENLYSNTSPTGKIPLGSYPLWGVMSRWRLELTKCFLQRDVRPEQKEVIYCQCSRIDLHSLIIKDFLVNYVNLDNQAKIWGNYMNISLACLCFFIWIDH